MDGIGPNGDRMSERQAVMAVCAEASRAELDAALKTLCPLPPHRDLRPPETGLVMLRGRMGGGGAAFNCGEATATRSAVAVEGAPPGFAYQLGRDAAKARAAAILDALWQTPERRGEVEAALAPIRARLAGERDLASRRTAATRVEFFTLVRGEDE